MLKSSGLRMSCLLLAGLATSAAWAQAQAPAKQPQATQPAPTAPPQQAPGPQAAPAPAAPNTGAVGTPWTQSVSKDGSVVGIQLDEKQIEALRKVSTYFNNLKNLKGAFVQTTSENKRLRGQFFVKQPGRFRFDYSRPSRQIIISDGNQIAIQDTDIDTDDRLTLEQTPMRVLLRKDVDLLRDAKIFDIQESVDIIMIVLQDKASESGGKIRLFMTKAATDLELKEWITTDAQGLDTKLEVANLIRTEEIDAKIFKIESVALRKITKPQ
jgi:outer membrane lipoprotein-sorting protein